MKMKANVLGLAILILAGCHSNPYPDQGQLTAKPVIQKPHDPIYGVEVEDTLKFQEGKLGEYPVTGHVPSPGVAIVTFQHLPAGAKYDKSKGVLQWTPDYEAGNDPNDPTVKEKDYRITVFVGNSLDPKSQTARDITLNVKDTPRAFKMDGFSKRIEVTEGQRLTRTLTLQSEDFAKGPFRVIPDGLPDGAVLHVDTKNPSNFILDYTPGFRVVTQTEDTYYHQNKTFKFTVTAYDPRGNKVETPAELTVNDERQMPLIVAPTEVSQSLDVSFVVSSEDPNGEVAPEVTLTNHPAIGDWKLEALNATHGTAIQNPNSTFSLTGRNIPPSANGTTESVTVKSCTLGTYRNRDSRRYSCVSQDIAIHFVATVHGFPIIDRTDWTFGSFKSIRVGEQLTVSLPIRDGDNSPNAPVVTATADDPEVQVSWYRNSLTVRTSKVGHFRIQVTATSTYGLPTSESFWVETLPAQWPTLLIVGESIRNEEFLRMKGVSDDLQLINPELQSLDERALQGRRGFVLGTASFLAPSMYAPVEKASPDIAKIFIASPLVGNLNAELATEMKSLGLTVSASRVKLPCGANCGDVTSDLIWVGDAEFNPKGALTLDGKLTAESARPQPLVIDEKLRKCTPLVKMNAVGGTGATFVVAAQCNRAHGGTMVVSGFEWVDVKTSVPEDLNILSTWFKELMK